MFSKEFLNGDLNINELFDLQNEIWGKKNAELFGISQNATLNPFSIRENLAYDLEDYWNGGTCKLKERLMSPDVKMFKDREKMVLDSWDLEFNSISNLIGLFALFIYTAYDKDNNGNSHKLSNAKVLELVSEINELPHTERMNVINSKIYNGVEFVVEKKPCCYLPVVTQFGYRIRNSEYALRTQVARNIYLLRKINGVVKQNGWVYKDGKFTDGKNHFKDVKPYNYPLLNAILGEQVTEDNFTKCLDLMPEFDKNSVLYFDFHWFDEVEQSVLYTSHKIINAEKGKTVNYASIINSPKKYTSREMADLCSNLIIVKNKIKALEVSRSVLFPPSNNYTAAFSFTDCNNIFDAFKVTTNGLAGRARVMLDNYYVEDGVVKVTYGGKTYNQYDIIMGNVPEEIKNQSNLSALSRAPYNYLNDAKRIMFCAKLRSQSVRVNGQIDDLTHEVPARVVFADLEGYSFGDSFVISESFAKKLEREVHKLFQLDKKSLAEYEVGQKLEIKDLVEIDQKNRFSALRDIVVDNVTNEDLSITARAPFGVGDKITNLHGSKGIVSIILPDEQMPYLKNDLSDNMKAGYVDIIVPGISVYRRKSTGQIFEALSRALDIPEMTLAKLEEKYSDVIKEYDSKSEFLLDGKTFFAPCGINNFIRLDHDAASKQSFAYIKSNYNYNLHTAEMELLNLAARGYYDILNELDIRSLNKHVNSIEKIRIMQETGVCPEGQSNTPYLKDYFKYLGWELETNKPLTREDVNSYWVDLYDVISNKEIDIFED